MQAAGLGQAYIQRVLAQLLIEVVLLLGHVGVQDELLLARQAGLHVTLHPPQQEGLQDGMQLGDHLHGTRRTAAWMCKLEADASCDCAPQTAQQG